MDGNIRYIQHGFTWQATQGDHERIFEIGFRSALQRRTGKTAQCAAAADCRLVELQLVLTKSTLLGYPSPVRS
jgi:hypothetical protein